MRSPKSNASYICILRACDLGAPVPPRIRTPCSPGCVGSRRHRKAIRRGTREAECNEDADMKLTAAYRANAEINFRNGGSAEGSLAGAEAGPRQPFPKQFFQKCLGGGPGAMAFLLCQRHKAKVYGHWPCASSLQTGHFASAIWKFLSAFALSSARVPACNFRRPAGKPVRRDAEHHTRDAYAPQTPQRSHHLEKSFSCICSKRKRGTNMLRALEFPECPDLP